MGQMFDLLDRLDKVEIKPVITYCLNEDAVDIADIIRKQLKKGVNANNDPFYFYQSQPYALDKEQKNPLPGLGRADFYLTGAYYNGIQAVVNSDQYTFSVFGTDSKSAKLEERVDDQGSESSLLYGMNNESKTEFIPILQGQIIGELKKQLGL